MIPCMPAQPYLLSHVIRRHIAHDGDTGSILEEQGSFQGMGPFPDDVPPSSQGADSTCCHWVKL